MKKRVLITGACGFVGRYFCEYLDGLEDRPVVIGTDIIDCESKFCDLFYKLDLSSSKNAGELISKSRPDFVIHFAGTFGTDDAQEIFRVNVLSASAILEAIRIYKSDAVVIMAGSAAEYGRAAPEQLPETEQMPCQPVTAYGLSKLLATQVSLYYHKLYGLAVMIVRPFQLIGKGVTARLAPGAFVEQINKAISEKTNIIKVGNLESSRDFLDVRDAVAATWMLCQKPQAGEIFNICSGSPVRIRDLLEMMIKESGAQLKVEIDPARLRGKADVNQIYGSYQKLHHHCGWCPTISLSESVKMMLDNDA